MADSAKYKLCLLTVWQQLLWSQAKNDYCSSLVSCLFSFYALCLLVWPELLQVDARHALNVHCSNRQSSHSPTFHLSSEMQQAWSSLCKHLRSVFSYVLFQFSSAEVTPKCILLLLACSEWFKVEFSQCPSSLHKLQVISVFQQPWIVASDCACCVHRVTQSWLVLFDMCEWICEYIVVILVQSSSLPRIHLPLSPHLPGHTFIARLLHKPPIC